MFKFKTKNLTLAVAIYTALVGSTYVNAKSVTVIGDLEAKSPKISLNQNSNTIEAFVENAVVNVFQDTDSGCELTTDENIAKTALNDDGLTCHLKVVAPYKMQLSENETKTQYVLSGTIDKVGVTEIPVSSTFFSGSTMTPVLALTEKLQVTAIEPKPLTVSTLEIDAGYKKVSGTNVIEINTPNASNALKMHLDTELKSYARYINGGDYGNCNITLDDKGKSLGCGLDLSKFTFGSVDDRLGEIEIPLFADATNKYFETSNKKIVENVTIKWDSRLPVDVGDLVGKAPLGASMTTEDGVEITAAPGVWKTVVSTPHYSRGDNWWNLAAELVLTPTEGATTSAPDLIVNGQDLGYLWKSSSIPRTVTLTSAAVMNGKYAELSFDMNEVVEGVYDSHITIKDKLDNKIQLERKASQVEKISPEALFIVDGTQVYEGRVPQIYFANQIDFAIWSRFRKITIVSATIDGKPFEYKDVNGEGYHFKGVSLPKELPFNSRLDFKVEYVDDRGVKGEIVKKLDVMPFSFISRYLSGYADVQEYGGDLRQADGRDCVFYEDLERAKNDSFSSSYELHCVVNWVDLDTGIKPTVEAKRVILKGYLEEDQLEQKYSVTFFDFKGNKETTTESSITFENIVTPPVRLEIVNGNVIKGDENKAFAIPLSGGTSAEVYASLVNADAVISAVNPFGDDVVYLQDQLGFDSNTPPKAKVKIRSGANKLWETGILAVKAGYKHSSDFDTTEQMTMVYVPDSNVDMYYKSNQVQAINTKPFEITTGIGIYDKATKTYHYDQKVHGEWMVQLQQRVFGGEYENVGQSVLLPESGSYTFIVDSSALEGNESYKYRVISTIVSKYPGYTRVEEGKSITVKVVKGGPVDAVIEVSKTERLTPYKGKGTLKFKSTADSKAWGKTKWEYREVGSSSWVLLDDTEKVGNLLLTDTGTYEMRATITNSNTGVTSEAVSEPILVFDVPEAELVYNRSEFVGHEVKLAIDVDGDVLEKDLDIEWSLDSCETFNKLGKLKYSFTKPEAQTIKLCARIAYKNTEQAGKSRWYTMKKSMKIIDVEPVRIRTYTDKTSEVGFESILKGRVTIEPNMRHKVEASWYTPTGEKIPTVVTEHSVNSFDLTAKYTMKQEDLEAQRKLTKPFVINAALAKVSGSESSVSTKMEVLRYDFPEWELSVRRDYVYAPTESRAKIEMVKEPEVEVDYTFEWLKRDGLELIDFKDRETTSSSRYKVVTAGVNEYAVLVSDSRGNSELVTAFNSSEKPQSAAIELKARFGNDFMRTPLDTVIKPYVDYEHRKDRAISSEWFVNGILVSTGEGNTAFDAELPEGSNVIKYVVKSKLGATDEQSINVDVVANKLPICKIEQNKKSSLIEFQADCHDEDGRVEAYLFEFPEFDRVGATKVYRLSHETIGDARVFTVKLTATDDSSESVVIEETVNFAPNE